MFLIFNLKSGELFSKANRPHYLNCQDKCQVAQHGKHTQAMPVIGDVITESDITDKS